MESVKNQDVASHLEMNKKAILCPKILITQHFLSLKLSSSFNTLQYPSHQGKDSSQLI